MIKVLNIISDTNIGGAGTVLLNYLAAHDSDEFDISVALPRGGLLKSRLQPLGIPVFELDNLRDKSFDPPAIKELQKLIHQQQPDLVHTHGALSGRIAAKRCKKPVVFTRHSAFESSPIFKKGLGRAVFRLISTRYADKIIAVSDVCRDDLISCGVPGSMIEVILNGAPPINKLSPEQRESVRRKYGAAQDTFLAGIVARIEPYKGQMFVIEAAKLLKDQGRNFKIIVAGTGSQETQVKKRADELGLADIVIFTGFINDVDTLLNALDVQINASTVEATSISLLEGMSIGLPAAASDDGGNPRVILDGVNGLLFKSRDCTALAGSIARLMDSPELRDSLGTGAAEVYNRLFTCERLSRETETVYLKTLEVCTNGYK